MTESQPPSEGGGPNYRTYAVLLIVTSICTTVFNTVYGLQGQSERQRILNLEKGQRELRAILEGRHPPK